MSNAKNAIQSTSFLGNRRAVVLSFIFIAVIINSIFFESNSDTIFFGLLGFYIGVVFFYKLRSKLTFLFCLTLLIIMFIEYLVTGTSLRTEKTAVWFFLFMATGIVQQWKEH